MNNINNEGKSQRISNDFLGKQGGLFHPHTDSSYSRQKLKSFLQHFIDKETCQLSTNIDLWKFHLDTGMPITDALVKEVSITIPNLQGINLSKCKQITDNSLISISQCSQLESVALRECSSISMIGIRNLFLNCKHIKSVDLSNCSSIVDDSILRILSANLEHLEVIRVDNSEKVTDQGLCELAYCCNKISEISIQNCYRVGEFGNRALRQIGEKCHSIQKLDLKGCKYVNDKGIQNIAFGCPSLQYIDLSGCRKIHGKALLKLAENCDQISYLATNSCLNITDDEFRQIAGKISQTITFIDFSNCTLLGVEALDGISSTCKLLKELRLGGCTNINDDAISTLINVTGELHILYLNGCEQITAKALNFLIPRGDGTGISYLNVTGCKKIGVSKLKLVAKKFEFSDLIITKEFRGFQPKQDELASRESTKIVYGRNVAATNIQRLSRGRFVRNGEYKELRRERIILNLLPKAQACLRCYLKRREYIQLIQDRKLSHAATILQSHWRGHLDRKYVKVKKYAILEIQRKQMLAIIIQSIYRGYIKRQNLKQLKRDIFEQMLSCENWHKKEVEASIVIQRNFQARKGRKLAKQLSNERDRIKKLHLRRHRSAIRIQRIYRGSIGRHIAIQERLILAQNEKKWLCARKIQALRRGIIGKRKAESLMHRQKYSLKVICVGKIQCVWRGNKGRDIANKKRAALILQKHKVDRSVTIQRIYRGILGRMEFQRTREEKLKQNKRKEASQTIQRLYRGYKGREKRYITYHLRVTQLNIQQMKTELEAEKDKKNLLNEKQAHLYEKYRKEKRQVSMLENEISVIEHTKSRYVDSDQVTGALQRCDKKIVKRILQNNLEVTRNLFQLTTKCIDEIVKEIHENEMNVQKLERNLRSSILDASKHKKSERSTNLRNTVRERKNATILIQKYARCWMVKLAFSIHTRSFWNEEWDEITERTIYVNNLSNEILPFKPLEMKLHERYHH